MVSIVFYGGHFRVNLTFNQPMPMNCQFMVLDKYTGIKALNRDKAIELSYRANKR